MIPLRSRHVLPLAAVALLASACTGASPSADHTPAPTHHSRPSQAPSTSAPVTPSTPAAPSTSGSPTGSATQAASPPCSAAELNVSLKSAGAAAGSDYVRLVFTNTGNATCSLTGFPGVSLVRHSNGAPIGAPADRVGPIRTVSLDGGASAQARVQITDAQNYPEEKCGQTPADGLRVYPPNQTESVFLPDTVLACADQSVQILHVQSVHAGA